MKITQINTEDDGRYYEIVDDFDYVKKYRSVTALLDKFKDKTALFKWKARIGEEKAQEITTNSANRGTNVHKLIELYFLGNNVIDVEKEKQENELYNVILPVLNKIKPLYIERKVYWEDENLNIGFGGTVDICGQISTDIFTDEDLPPKIMFVGDWKTWNKEKNIIGVTRDGNKYYPLISYYLQLSAYCAAINQRTNNKYNINKCLIFGMVEGEKTPYIYYLDTDCVKYYWDKMYKLTYAYYNNESFNWKEFEQYADIDNMLGKRLYLK